MDCDSTYLHTLYEFLEAEGGSFDKFDDDEELHIVFLLSKVIFGTYASHRPSIQASAGSLEPDNAGQRKISVVAVDSGKSDSSSKKLSPDEPSAPFPSYLSPRGEPYKSSANPFLRRVLNSHESIEHIRTKF